MCFSLEASLIAWIISIIIAGILWCRNKKYDRWNALFICSFAMIQLWEAGIWYNGQDVWVKLIAITLAIQPLAQTLGAYYSTNKPYLLGILGIIYLIILSVTIYKVFNNEYKAKIGPNKHLVWDSRIDIPIMPIIYLFGLFFGLLYGLPETIPLIVVGLGTLGFSMTRVSTNEIGSYWCYTAVIYSLIAISL